MIKNSTDGRLCTNCYKNSVDESKQNFIYRTWEGIKWMAVIRPVCDECIEAGEYKDEDGDQRLYLGSSRVPKPKPYHGYGMCDNNAEDEECHEYYLLPNGKKVKESNLKCHKCGRMAEEMEDECDTELNCHAGKNSIM